MTTEIKNIKNSIMGTVEFDLKAKGQRGFQNFICYPINGDSKAVKIQSDKRIGVYDPEKGTVKLSKSRSNGSYFHHLQIDQLTESTLNGIDNQTLKMQIFASTSKQAGKKENRVMYSDNSGAINIFDL